MYKQEERPQRYTFPPELYTWVRHQHRSWANVRRNAEKVFPGVKLHVRSRDDDGWSGVAHPFSKEFEDFLQQGVKELRLHQEGGGWWNTEARYQRVEEAINWLQGQNARLGRVVLFYSEPFQDESVVALAAALSVNTDQPARMFKQGLERIWHHMGKVW